MNSTTVPQSKTHTISRTFVLLLVLILLLSGTLSGCGKTEQIVGQWHMTKVLVGDKEYDAVAFLDPTKKTDGTFIIQFYGDNTLIATGSLGTIKGASDGEWEKVTENTFLMTIDNQEREVKMVEDILFMDIELEDGTFVIVFERE